jgi:hypothetical protein
MAELDAGRPAKPDLTLVCNGIKEGKNIDEVREQLQNGLCIVKELDQQTEV